MKKKKYVAWCLNVDVDLDEIVLKYSLTNNITKSEAIRRLLTNELFSIQKQEEKIVKKYDEFEAKVDKRIEEEFSKLRSMLLRSNLYELTNLHLLKLIIKDNIGKELSEEEQNNLVKTNLSVAKTAALIHEVDSINSKERFEKNIIEDHVRFIK